MDPDLQQRLALQGSRQVRARPPVIHRGAIESVGEMVEERDARVVPGFLAEDLPSPPACEFSDEFRQREVLERHERGMHPERVHRTLEAHQHTGRANRRRRDQPCRSCGSPPRPRPAPRHCVGRVDLLQKVEDGQPGLR